MLHAFRALGGTAQNIAVKSDGAGPGIVPANPERAIGVHVPPNLIFPVSDLELIDGRLRIRDSAVIGNAERSFFEGYSDSFTWSSGCDRADQFLSGLDSLPADVRTVLRDEFGIEFPGPEPERTERWLLQSRLLTWRGKIVFVPILELVQHDPKAQPYSERDGVTLTGTFGEEVRMGRSMLSPFAAFWKFGIASPERQAFSLPMTLTTESGREVVIEQLMNLNATLGAFPVPDFKVEGPAVQFSCLMIGSSRTPKLSRAIFYRIMREAGETKPEHVFDSVLHINRLSFLKLLEALESQEGQLVPTLRKVVRFQLEAMSWCIGTREL
jgi:hypothetical protein